MQSKTCSKCGIEKPLDEFYKRGDRRGKTGLTSSCKTCVRAATKTYRDSHKEESKSYCKKNKGKRNKASREYHDKHKEELNAYCRVYNVKHKERLKVYNKIYNDAHKEEQKARRKVYNDAHREEQKVYSKLYRKKNKEKCKLYDKLYAETHRKERRAAADARSKETNIQRRHRRKTDAGYKLNENISRAIYRSLKRNNGNKNGRHWETLVGFTVKQLKKHLEKLFAVGMTWDNYGKLGWEIDHRIPISVHNFMNPEHRDFRRCWSLSNLQPLWGKKNREKHNKITAHFQPSLSL